MKSALGYVELAENVNGPIPKPAAFSYIWGDALDEFEQFTPDVRIINLETSVTTSPEWAPKGINYRMHPNNVPCLTAAAIDCCVLANNHVLDWGPSGLAETLETLRQSGIQTAGAGRNLSEAKTPALIEVASDARVIVFAFGTTTCGIPPDWAATPERPGVNLLRDLSEAAVNEIARRIRAVKRQHDVVVASIHWGGNWGYDIPPAHREFAHRLVDQAAVDIVHGHSSHHPMGIEVHHGKPILYGCGDFLNDYEGIGGREQFRSELALAYFITVGAATQDLVQFEMRPFGIRRFQLRRASREDARWLRDTLQREGRKLGTDVRLEADGTLRLGWRSAGSPD